MADGQARLARLHAHRALHAHVEEDTSVEREALRGDEHVRGEVAEVLHRHVDAYDVGSETLDLRSTKREARSERHHAQEGRGLARARLGEELVRRVEDAHQRREPAHLDVAELRVGEGLEGLKDSPRVRRTIERREREEVFAIEMGVVIDEGLLPRDPDPLEEIPELADVRHHPALSVRKLGEVAVERRVRLVYELLE